MKHMMLLTILLILFLSGSVISVGAESVKEYTEVKIYYISWSIVTRAKLTLNAVRRMSHITTTIVNRYDIENFIKWGRFNELKNVEGDIRYGDPRLVIDMYSNSAERTTFYANRRYLYSEDSTKKLLIDKEFRSKFYFGPDPFDIIRSRTKPD